MWNAPATPVTDQLILASFWRQQIRDNEEVLRAGGIAIASQAAGNFVYVGTTTQLARRAMSAAGRVPFFTAGAWSDTDLRTFAYPVGSIYISTSATNPATLLGFGTWSAFAIGRGLVGIDAGQAEFDTIEETGGEKTHVLTTSEMPAHNHGVTDPTHSHLIKYDFDNSGPFGPHDFLQDLPTASHVNSQSVTTGVTLQNAGDGGAHNNLNPYIACHMWKRTA